MLLRCLFVAVMAIAVTSCSTTTESPSAVVLKELAPTGILRIPVQVSSMASGFPVVRDASGQPRGVATELGEALAKRLGVQVRFVPYSTGAALFDGLRDDSWDITFIPVLREQEGVVDYGALYYTVESTYLVPPVSSIRSIADVDRSGVRVAAQTASTQAAYLKQSLKNAQLLLAPDAEGMAALARSGNADVLAHSRTILVGVSEKWPGVRILDGGFLTTRGAVAVPKGRKAALEYVSRFVEEAKTSGAVQRALDNARVKGVSVPVSR
jgi:polar amino acid transport system substrate-binding protein